MARSDVEAKPRPLALHHLTVRESSVFDLVKIAAENMCEAVCIFTHAPRIPIPGASFTEYPLVDCGNQAEFIATLRANGVGVGNIEFFPVTETLDLEDYRKSLAVGAEVGAKRMVTHIHDGDDNRALDTLGRLCDEAARFDLKLGLEFMGLTPACASIQRASWFVSQVGRTNIGIALDALHLIRTGGTAEDVAAIPADQFSYSQICDGHGLDVTGDYRREGQDRELPGDGDWPLHAIYTALPASTPLDVEVPSVTRVKQGVPPRNRARIAVERSRTLIDSVTPTR
ncbi:xylose isomerase [Sphingobium lactosutens]|uniref:sugar phosphate isomerase/epimerase family protein n=1 Tax=Sphingobium lactosutens TaxID=522773 RepID=UPI0015BCEB51|nr:TIM barrel protein [Sphingobium lactosutens]NWK99165.1 xylose isomerase [Sphingobium lactosutens]